ncbi:MAG: type II secretion system F family protein [Planctomycetota bacterium]|nr:MAG: type II secretion system F family protein [Planctomycetota bacterium]
MPNYRYQARNNAGQVNSGTVSADGVAAAAASLRTQGLHVVSLSPAGASEAGSGLVEAFKRINSSKPTTKHVLDFTTQLAVMIRAGINLRAALEGVAEQTNHAQFKKVVMNLKDDVESGKQFSEAIAKYPKLFGQLYVSMVRASEMSGSFSEMLDRIAGYIGQQIETRKMVVGASIYPGIIATMAIGVTVFMLSFVLPRFYTIFEGKEDVLPWSTKFLMGLSKFMTAEWPFIVGGAVAVAGLLVVVAKTEVGSFWIDKLKLSLPMLKNMFNALYINRSLQTMGQLINAGVPMLDTLSITGEISGNQLYKGMWLRVHSSVKQGRKITGPLLKDALMPRSVVQMIAAGEESGKLGEVLDEISGYYAKQLKEQIKAVTSMIEPVMIVVMGSVVGFIAMAVILPIFKMSQLVG